MMKSIQSINQPQPPIHGKTNALPLRLQLAQMLYEHITKFCWCDVIRAYYQVLLV